MSRAAPTTGEWKADGPGVYVDRLDGSNIRIGCGDIDARNGLTQPEACANARLWGAAKDLLRELEFAAAFIEAIRFGGPFGGACDKIRVDRLPDIRAAIAKAKGEP